MPEVLFDYESRLKKVRSLLEKDNLDFVLITNLQNLYWLSGTAQYGMLLIHKNNEPVLFIRRNFFRAQKESVLKNVVELKKTSQILDNITKQGFSIDNLKIGMELDSLPASYMLNYQKLLKGAQISNIETKLRELRMVKDEKELAIHRLAGKMAQKNQEAIPPMLKPGVKEYEIAAEVMNTSMKNGSMHYCIFNGMLENWFIVTSGENLWTSSTFPAVLTGDGHSNANPIGYSNRSIKKGDIVMCDYAQITQGYHADHARTYYVETVPDKFKERYLILKNAYLETVDDYLKDGNPINIIYNKMKEILDKEGLGKYFQGDGYYYQGLGHGVGLELDEPPFVVPNNEIILKENMVISLEPKIIVPEWGAIDLEDNFIVKKGKPEQITNTTYLF